LYKKIVLAYDGSESGQRALLDCQEIGQWSQAKLYLVAVMPLPVAMIAGEAWAYNPTPEGEEKARYQSVLALGVDRLRQAGLEVQGEVVTGHSVDEIVRVANTVQAELIVVGHKHLESWTARWWRGGSVSKSLIEFAPCSGWWSVGADSFAETEYGVWTSHTGRECQFGSAVSRLSRGLVHLRFTSALRAVSAAPSTTVIPADTPRLVRMTARRSRP